MARRYLQTEAWVERVRRCASPRERDALIGVSLTLAARLLGVTRSRVHQLVKANKLSVVDVFDGRVRIGHLVTLASIESRRRTVKPRRTQWRPHNPPGGA